MLMFKGVNPSQKVGGGMDSKLGRSGGMLSTRNLFSNLGTLKWHFQRFGGTCKFIVQCA